MTNTNIGERLAAIAQEEAELVTELQQLNTERDRKVSAAQVLNHQVQRAWEAVSEIDARLADVLDRSNELQEEEFRLRNPNSPSGISSNMEPTNPV